MNTSLFLFTPECNHTALGRILRSSRIFGALQPAYSDIERLLSLSNIEPNILGFRELMEMSQMQSLKTCSHFLGTSQ